MGEALTNPRVLGLSIVDFGLLCGLYGLTYWLPQIVKGVVIDIGLDKVTGVSINALTGYLIAVPFAFATAAMIWWTRRSDITGERVWHVVFPAVVSGLALIASAHLGNPVLKKWPNAPCRISRAVRATPLPGTAPWPRLAYWPQSLFNGRSHSAAHTN